MIETLREAAGAAAGGQGAEPVLVAATAAEALDAIADMVEAHGREASWLPRDAHEARTRAALAVERARYVVARTATAVCDLGTGRAQARGTLLADHVVLVCGQQDLLDDLDALFARHAADLREGRVGPRLACITGPSRTADIEKMLVVPAHGPSAVTLLLVQQGLDWPRFLDALEQRCGAISPARPGR
jgi:L-lactate dehydrogenase complex protein LldG